jgi:hypothetical protein
VPLVIKEAENGDGVVAFVDALRIVKCTEILEKIQKGSDGTLRLVDLYRGQFLIYLRWVDELLRYFLPPQHLQR